MLASINPLGERSRNTRFSPSRSSPTWSGRSPRRRCSEARSGSHGAAARQVVAWSAAGAAVAGGGGCDKRGRAAPRRRRRRGLRLPTESDARSTRTSWPDPYHGWVYGLVFGFQLGLGVVTIVTTAFTYVTFLATFLAGSLAAGALIGGTYGAVRAATILGGSTVDSPERLARMHERLRRWEASRAPCLGGPAGNARRGGARAHARARLMPSDPDIVRASGAARTGPPPEIGEARR